MRLQAWEWYSIGKYGTIAALAGIGWLSRQKWMPHRHDGYVIGNSVRGCSICGQKPETAQCQHCEHLYQAGGRCARGCPPDGYGRCWYSCGAIVAEETMTSGYCAECWALHGSHLEAWWQESGVRSEEKT